MDNQKEVTLIGLGIGSLSTVTGEGLEALEKAQCIIGAPRLLDGLASFSGEKVASIDPNSIKEYIHQSPHTIFSVVFSGDIGFYSGAKKLIPLLTEYTVRPIAGLSTPLYFAAQLLRPWENFHLVSGHGLSCSPVGEVKNHKETFFLTDSLTSPSQICRGLTEAGLGELQVSIGEALSYEHQRILTGKAKEFIDTVVQSPNVMLVDNPALVGQRSCRSGLPDEDFIRGKVPMTKEEVRSVILSKLDLQPHHIVVDVGAGTGSVSIEAALQASEGRVYAIERNKEAVSLIRQNIQRFSLTNIDVVEGEAPDALVDLPAPHRLFIGGTGRQLEAILQLMLEKNPDLVWVATCVTLETLAQFITLKEKLSLQDFKVVQLGVTRYPQRGAYLMADAQNPIFIISGSGRG